MELNKIYNGLALETIKTFPDKSINSVITSPPYWQLRDYGFSEQWGLEPTYQEYLEHLWSLMDEIWRVLKDDGTVWINLGDSYNSNKRGSTHNISTKLGLNENQSKINKKKQSDVAVKCLLLIPHRFAIGCIDRGWIMRNDIVWAKRNSMPESVTDRFSKKHEYFFFMTKSQKYYFDLDSIRKPLLESSIKRLSQNIESQKGSDRVPNKSNGLMKAVAKTKIPKENSENYGSPRARNHRDGTNVSEGNFMGANPGTVSDFWDIPTRPSSEKHYATFNDKLIEKPIVAGCPEGGIILDPFCGTATTLLRAYELNRKIIGIEGSKEYYNDANIELNNMLAQLKMF